MSAFGTRWFLKIVHLFTVRHFSENKTRFQHISDVSSLRYRRNWIMVKWLFKQRRNPYSGLPTCVPRIENAPRCPVKGRGRFANQVERKFETHWNLFETQNKDLVGASQTLITGVRFRLRRMLGCVRSLRVVQVNERFSFIFFPAFICHESGAPCLAYVPGQQLLISGGRKGNICILGFLRKLCQSVNSVASFWSKVWPTWSQINIECS